jgi:hypothetical protein
MRKSQKDARWDGSPTITISDRSFLPPDIRRDVETNHRGNPILTPELEAVVAERILAEVVKHYARPASSELFFFS